MKNTRRVAYHFILLILAAMAGFLPLRTLAHGDTAAEAQKGAVLDAAVRSGEKKCVDLVDDDFETLGEFFMDRMMGQAHASMNEMMETMMGEKGEEQMHITMGKRLSGCETAFTGSVGGTSEMVNMMPMMMGMMGGGPNVGGISGVSLRGLVILSYINVVLLGILLLAFIWKLLSRGKIG